MGDPLDLRVRYSAAGAPSRFARVIRETGFAVLAGLGYDLRVGRNLSLVPSATWQFANFEGGGANVLQVALGITFH